MKTLFTFAVDKEEEIDDVQISKNEAGEEIKITKKVKKLIPQTFAIKKPNRSLFDDAELFYGIKLSEGIKAGLLTRALLEKRFLNDGGVLAETEKEEISKLYKEFLEAKAQIDTLTAKQDKSAEEIKNLDDLNEKLTNTRLKIQQFEADQISLYDHTAESKARNKTIFWWILHLSLKQATDGTLISLFPGETFEEKQKVYDSFEDSEEGFINKIIRRLVYIISFWYVGRATNEEEFAEIYKNYAD